MCPPLFRLEQGPELLGHLLGGGMLQGNDLKLQLITRDVYFPENLEKPIDVGSDIGHNKGVGGLVRHQKAVLVHIWMIDQARPQPVVGETASFPKEVGGRKGASAGWVTAVITSRGPALRFR